MDNNHNISEQDRNSILNHIIDCANSALQSEDIFQKAMLDLAAELRKVFSSEYCSIGIVIDEYAEDCFISIKESNDELSNQQKESLESVKRVNIKDDSNTVSLALQSDHYAWFKEEEMDALGNYSRYKSILHSKEVRNSCVIPIRDKSNHNYGFIQLINTQKPIDDNPDALPFNDAFIGLVQVIINYKKFKLERSNRLRDANFYSQMQDKKNDVDELLDSIMKYFSEEFNAAIVSFRIPLLNGYNKDPIFYLRSVFVHPSIEKRNELKKRYFEEWHTKSYSNMPGVEHLKCCDQGKIIKSTSAIDFSKYDLELNNNTLIMPICLESDKKCIHPLKKYLSYCNDDEHHKCKERFKKYYGFFRLRISKTDLYNPERHYNADFDEVKERLSYLSKQITLLIDSIVNKNDNESLNVFQKELKNSSFIKIQDFDERCVEIIKDSVQAKVCSIYRYDERTKLLTLNATTAKTIFFRLSDHDLYFEPKRIKQSCFIHILQNNLLARAYQKKQCEYVLNIHNSELHQSAFIEFIKSDNGRETAMAIPMIKKDGSCAGVVFLLGKEEHEHSISTAYWEQDINHIEFIVNTLTRISESDTERLTFLSHLSHELLAPVTELVYDNDLTLNIAERNFDSISKRQLIAKIRENIDHNLLFKYIINDTEFIYSSTGRSIDYNIVKQNKPQAILLDAIRLLEKEANESKGLTIKTYISEMPPLFFDRERVMQVFLNLLKNAIRYADSHTEICISYNRRDDGIHEIRFADFGIEILEEERETIFELFHRGKEAKERIPRGTGMGLYIARDIMRAHGGDCYVRRLNNPTEFAITLPNRE